jgi:tetratricopeptide (TPR) repeat protein
MSVALALGSPPLWSALLVNVSNIELTPAYMGMEVWPGPACGSRMDVAATPAGRATQLDPNHGRTWLALARTQWLSGQCEAALASWQTAERAPGILFELGRALDTLGRRADALAPLQSAESARYLVSLADYDSMQGNRAAARDLYALALDVEPNPEAADGLANYYVEQGQTESAVAVWLLVADGLGAESELHWLALGEAAKLQKDWPSARAALERAAQLAPEPYNVYLRLGRLLLAAQDWAGVIETSEKAVMLQPTASSEPYTLAARAEMEQGDYNAAVQWCDRGRAAIPTDAWPDYVAGQAAERFGYDAQAEQRYLAALKKDPNHFSAILQLGLLKYRQGQVGPAVAYMEKIAPTGNCGVLTYLTQWYSELGDASKAQSYAAQRLARCGQ